ncbi:E3 ubiquitin-protein ligase TRIM71-like [Acanthaster planci]|uniref:E3 ubiquitin-protein ligase TRIM71-like n=1 Tax=Acanthaster planci TaxID=133434 RepID=A0A8B7ZQA5_ACAPL|nr:E3 ubiquitin-protein ligase TRIM71-like [Acanthaster planci]
MATNVLRAEELDRQFLQCPLCIDRLKKPKVLACQHTFCASCLELWVNQNDGKLSCPICRMEYPLGDGGVASLPDNFFVNGIIDFIKQKRRVSSSAPTCHGCDSEAAYHCFDCNEFLCVDCANAHRRLRMTRSHRLTSVDEYQTSGMLVRLDSLDNSAKFCANHDREQFDLYCETCDVPICYRCRATNHRPPRHKHRKRHEAAEQRRVVLAQLVERAKGRVETLRDNLAVLKETNRQLQLNRSRAEAMIRERAESLAETVARYEQETLEELNQCYTTRREALNSETELLQQVLDKTSSVCSVTENLLSEGNDTALLFVNRETTRKLEETIDIEITTTIEENGHIGFACGEMEFSRASLLGHIECHQAIASQSVLKPEEEFPRDVLAGEDACVCLETRDASGNPVVTGGAAVSAKLCSPADEVGLARVKDNEDGTYDIVFRSNGEGRHRLFVAVFGRQIVNSPFEIIVHRPARKVLEFGAGGCITRLREPWGVAVSAHNGDVFVADTGNNCIRVFDLNGNHRKQLNFPNFPSKFEPLGLTLIGDEENILVTDHVNRQVLLCTRDGQLLRRFGAGELRRPCGVAINSIGSILIADHGTHCIHFYDSAFRYRKDIGGYGKATGEFRCPIAIGVNSKDEIIVSDRENHRVQIFDPDGEFLAAFSSTGDGEAQLRYPTGLAVDTHDNIIVCNDWNNRVLMFDQQGRFLRRLDSDADALQYPLGLAVTNHGKVVVVDYGNEAVKVFKV